MRAATWVLSIRHPGLFLLGLGLALMGIGHGLGGKR